MVCLHFICCINNKKNIALSNINNEPDNDYRNYAELLGFVQRGDWNSTKNFLDLHPEAITAKITYLGQTPLHVAIEAQQKKKTAKKLLEKMIRLNKDIEIKDFQGVTYLHCAIAVGDLEMTQFLVTKNVNFVRIGWGQQNLLPVTLPILCGRKETARYLYLHTRPEDLKPETGHRGASVLSATIYSTKTLGKNCSFGYIFMSTHLLVIVNYLTFPGLILRCI